MAALLGHRAQSVIALERIARAGGHGRRQPAPRRRAANASVREMDGKAGLPGDGPFDVIMLSGSVAEVPQALLDQLNVGGRLLAIVGQEPVMRAVRITRLSPTALQSQDLFDTVAPRLASFGELTRFHF
jgi:protein-L-isoaspartate(D-aspartate) O-methyltransferase